MEGEAPGGVFWSNSPAPITMKYDILGFALVLAALSLAYWAGSFESRPADNELWQARALAAERRCETLEQLLNEMAFEIERLNPRGECVDEGVRYVHSSGGKEHECTQWDCALEFRLGDAAWSCGAPF